MALLPALQMELNVWTLKFMYLASENVGYTRDKEYRAQYKYHAILAIVNDRAIWLEYWKLKPVKSK
jgi:hypothetical protein